MFVIRSRFSNGISQDEIAGFYHAAEVTQTSNGHWPGLGFYLKSGKWPDDRREPDPGYEYLVMWGAELWMFDSGNFMVTGFVRPHMGDEGSYLMERWHCYSSNPYRKGN